MVYPYYQDHQSPAVPYPADYDESLDRRNKRSPVLADILAGLIAVLVMAFGILLGLQLSGPAQNPQSPVPTPATATASAPTIPAAPSSKPDARVQEQRQEAVRLDQLDIPISESTRVRADGEGSRLLDQSKDHRLPNRQPVRLGDRNDNFPGGHWASAGSRPYDSDQNTFVTAHDSRMVANIVEKDMVTMFVQVQGAYTYDTQIGGSTTVPSLLVNIIEPTRGLPSSPSGPSSLPTAAPSSVPLPTNDSVSGNQLRATAASDQSFVLSASERWVPQLSSKRLGMVAEGRTWTNAMIMNEHEQLRSPPIPVLAFCGRGTGLMFSDSDFWITVAGVSFPTADGALTWCTTNGIDSDHCYAKLISTTHPVDGSTAYNR